MRAGLPSTSACSSGPSGTMPTMVSASHSFSHQCLQAVTASRAQGGEPQASAGPASATTSPVSRCTASFIPACSACGSRPSETRFPTAVWFTSMSESVSCSCPPRRPSEPLTSQAAPSAPPRSTMQLASPQPSSWAWAS